MRVRLVVAAVVLTACTSSSSPDGLLPPQARADEPSSEPPPGADPALPVAGPHGGREAGSSPDAPDASSAAGDAAPAGGGGSDPYALARKACVDAVNHFRGMTGLAPLMRYPAKESCADAQATADASHHVDHYAYLNGAPSCIEDNVLDRQNECPGWYQPPGQAAADCVAAMFAEGPGSGAAHGHYTTMMNANYTRLSCGVRIDPGSPAGADTWIVLNFY